MSVTYAPLQNHSAKQVPNAPWLQQTAACVVPMFKRWLMWMVRMMAVVMVVVMAVIRVIVRIVVVVVMIKAMGWWWWW